MKKYLMSLAALMIALSASVLTSCNTNNNVPDDITSSEAVTPGTHVETLTIAFPEQTTTRVAIDDNYNLTGWEMGDVVTLVCTELIPENPITGDYEYLMFCGAYDFECTDPATGTFTGTLPNGTSVNDCQLAFYNATGFEINSRSSLGLDFKPKHYASQDMKDVIVMMAKNNNGHFAMEIFGSILTVRNWKDHHITASVKIRWNKNGTDEYIHYDHSTTFFYGGEYTDFSIDFGHSRNHTFTLDSDADTHIYIPAHGSTSYAIGLSEEGDAEDECSLVPFKTNPDNAKVYTKLLFDNPEEDFYN